MCRRALVFIPLAVVCGGCGTLANQSKDGTGRPYGGLRNSVSAMMDGPDPVSAVVRATDEMTSDEQHFFPVWPLTLASGFAFLDVPLSAAADSVFLPWDVFNTVNGVRRPLIGSLSIQRPPADTPATEGMGCQGKPSSASD
jgi:uncharacterized protein YceK